MDPQNIRTNTQYSIVDKDENTVNDKGIVATGMKIKVSDAKELVGLKQWWKSRDKRHWNHTRYIIGKESLNSTYLLAGDINKDNKVDITDVYALAMAITRNIKL